MEENNTANDGSRLLTAKERNDVRNKLKSKVFRMHVGIPLIGTILIVAAIVLIAVFIDDDNIVITFLSYACSFSLLWFFVGLYQ